MARRWPGALFRVAVFCAVLVEPAQAPAPIGKCWAFSMYKVDLLGGPSIMVTADQSGRWWVSDWNKLARLMDDPKWAKSPFGCVAGRLLAMRDQIAIREHDVAWCFMQDDKRSAAAVAPIILPCGFSLSTGPSEET